MNKTDQFPYLCYSFHYKLIYSRLLKYITHRFRYSIVIRITTYGNWNHYHKKTRRHVLSITTYITRHQTIWFLLTRNLKTSKKFKKFKRFKKKKKRFASIYERKMFSFYFEKKKNCFEILARDISKTKCRNQQQS